MPKFFCISDVHSFYEPMLDALSNAGFDPENPKHYLVVLGDVFDRGPDSERVLRFLMGIERKILIKGNHEDLLLDCCNRDRVYPLDIANGTYRTICDLGGERDGYSYDECRIDIFRGENYIAIDACTARSGKVNCLVIEDEFI